jgi:Prokaryotic N-terminal methylation motif
VSDLRAVLTASLIFMAANVLWFRRSQPTVLELAWLLFLVVVTAVADRVFPPSPLFFVWLPVLVVLNEVRLRLGLLDRQHPGLELYRYLPVMWVHMISGNLDLALWVAALLTMNRRMFRFVLVGLAGSRLPIGLSELDVDQIAPPPIRYDREKRQGGFTMVEAIVGMTIIATVSSGLLLASSGRAARLVHVRESAAAREAAVSALERSGALTFEELLANDQAEFPVPGDGEPGTIRVEVIEEDLARVTVTAPRRGQAPVTLVTLRSRRAP